MFRLVSAIPSAAPQFRLVSAIPSAAPPAKRRKLWLFAEAMQAEKEWGEAEQAEKDAEKFEAAAMKQADKEAEYVEKVEKMEEEWDFTEPPEKPAPKPLGGAGLRLQRAHARRLQK